MHSLARGLRCLVALAVTTCFAALACADQPAKPIKAGDYNPDHQSVNLFDGVKSGQLEVKLIPKDSTGGRVFITNKTQEPLNVKLPAAFGAVPILAQLGGRGGMGGGMGGGMMGGGGMMQPMGGGMGGMGGGGMGGGGGGGMGGMFNVPAQKTGNFKVTTVCLEHGRPEPRSTVTYEIRPLETISEKQAVREMCDAVGRGAVDQRVAQAAVWHLNNGMSWAKLAEKKIERADGDAYPYFSEHEIGLAMLSAQKALAAAETRSAQPVADPSAAPTLGSATSAVSAGR